MQDDTEVMKGYHRALKGTGKPVLSNNKFFFPFSSLFIVFIICPVFHFLIIIKISVTTATLTLGPTEVGKPVDDTIDILTLSYLLILFSSIIHYQHYFNYDKIKERYLPEEKLSSLL